MGRYYHRPLYAVDYGQVETVGGGVVLGDNDDNTLKRYVEDSGSILVYPDFSSAGIVPVGKEIIAVRAGHRQRNNGLFGLFNGWPVTFLRISNARQNVTKAYKQDGYIDSAREILGPPLYKQNLIPWTAAEITTMGTDSGSAVGDIGPSGNRWCAISESFIQVVWDDAVPVPSVPYPANGQTIATSSVDFSAQHPAPQMEQPVRTVFQVARDSGFTSNVKTFVGGLNQDTGGSSRSLYDSIIQTDSYTDLGPGVWYLRMKGRDYRGAAHESAWSSTTSFTISHTALPVPPLTAPQPGTTVPTPYGTRSAQFTTQPTGERMVGATWQFSKVADFSSGVVEWTNKTTGIWTASVGSPGIVSYNSEPDPTVAPGLYGAKVSLEDPSQYLSQGDWFARVKATDVYGQHGAWSSNFTFTVSHIPVVANPVPKNGDAFDQYSTPVTWQFTDPWNDDAQSAYRMRVYSLADLLLQDTGKVLSNVARATMSIPDLHQQEDLKYTLEVWDRDDVKSTTPLTSYFRLSLSPVITLPFPAPDEQIISGQPTLNWTVVYSHGGITQKSFQVKFLDAATGVTVFDSTTILSAAGTYTPPRPILKNLKAYQIALTVTDTDNLSSTLLRNFSTNFERPAYVPSYADSSNYVNGGYAEVYWPSGALDPYFFEWRIYRRAVDTDEWIYAGAVSDPAVRYFKDWLVGGSGYFEYSVTQAATRFGSIVESEQNPIPDSVPIFSDSYWFIMENDESMNVQLHRVTGDKFTNKRETNDFVIIGRGRKRNVGTRIGKEGNLTATIRPTANLTAQAQVRKLELLNETSRSVIMRDPFGNLTRISIGEISTDRVPGTGSDEFADLDIPYFEVK